MIVALGLSLFLTTPSFAVTKPVPVSPISCSAIVSRTAAKPDTAKPNTDAFGLAAQIADSLAPVLSEPFRLSLRGGSRPQLLPTQIPLFSDAVFSVAAEPTRPDVAFVKVLRNVDFWYDAGNKQILGTLSFISVDASGKVLEVGGGSPEILQLFRHHLRGRFLTKEEKARVAFVNRKIFDELKSNPTSAKDLEAFAKKRGWPEGLSDKNQVVLYNNQNFNLIDWAQKNKISNQDLVLAGWLSMRFYPNGRPRYSARVRWAALIPFFDLETGKDIVSWRMRQFSDDGGPKYLSWPKDRSYHDEDVSSESLYNLWKLPAAKGKRVILTEGEFKCMVTESALGIVTLGVPGITQFTVAMAKKIKKSEPKEVIVMLDRDPRGKGYFNVDSLTNTQREAYSIAMTLQRAGVTVRLANVPDAFNGSKAGIDDVLLKGVDGKARIQAAVASSVSPEEYARTMGIFPELMYWKEAARLLEKAIDDAKESNQRVAPLIPELFLRRAYSVLDSAKARVRDLFGKYFPGQTRFSTPWIHAKVLPTTGRIWVKAADESPVRILSAAEEIVWLNFQSRCAGVASASLRDCQMAAVSADFPLDEFEILRDVNVQGAIVPYLVIKKESGKAVIIVTFGNQKFSEEQIKATLRAAQFPQ